MSPTAAQDSLLTGFDEFTATRASEPAWLQDSRARAAATFRAEGLPTTRHEEWRFTPVTGITDVPARPVATSAADARAIDGFLFPDFGGPQLVFVDGRFAPALSQAHALPAGLRVSSIGDLLGTDPDLLQRHLGAAIRFRQLGFTALNDAWFTDGLVIVAEANVVVESPIHVLYFSTGAGTSYPRTLVVAGANSQLSLVESFAGLDRPYVTNAITEVLSAEGAHVDHYKVNRESLEARHVSSTHLLLERASVFSTHNISLGGQLTRNDINATLDGEGIECTVNGLYLADGDRLVDNHTAIDHAKPHCHSYEIYKGVLDGSSRGVFNGKIFVRQDAQKTDAKQTNQVLLLSDDATIDTKPQLEIFADDVKCTHGATVGQLSEESLFYLRARGIGKDDARALLIHAFAEDIVERIRIDGVRRALEQVLLARLPIRE
ncbi:Fe-S cluster assembly protein SufD [Luteitalea sp. TBR-22]|uniref:Fe-S cluster assembly protein SufD n=1 Tax=Luteitalea sp. TBR-22 TaxID=2802971 RepID=UPI001AF5E0FA|nr:Fe-S cluster assembly protein SufD [Luteitalea sp. TBR-22]BCS35931.1 Fe-S cluster assembly protein SufD [Luteitalea sp. TBR-22]